MVFAGNETRETKLPGFCCGEEVAADVDRRALDRHAEDEARRQVETVWIRGLDHEKGPGMKYDAAPVEGVVAAVVPEATMAVDHIPGRQ